MLRPTLIAAIALVGTYTYAQETVAKFNFKAPAGPAKQVFAELSKVAGVPLVASGPIANDVILVNVTDVTANDTMAKIATALNGEWRKEGSGWVLYRGTNLEAAEARIETAARVAEFRTNLKRIIDEHSKLGEFNSTTAKKLVDTQQKLDDEVSRQLSGGGGSFRISGDFDGVSRQTPAARAIVTLLSRMTDAQIASLTSESRVVFGLNPTRMQLPLPNGANQVLRKFIQDTQTYKDVRERNTKQPTGNVTRTFSVNGLGSEGIGDGDPRLGIGYAILTKEPGFGGSRTNVSVTLTVADPNGKTIASGQFFVGPNLNQSAVTGQTAPAANESPIKLSESAQELAKLLNQLSGGGQGGLVMRTTSLAIAVEGSPTTAVTLGGEATKNILVSPELRQKLLNPEQYDPLSFAPGEAFAFVSDNRNKDLVAYLPDTSFLPLTRAASDNATPTRFLSTATSSGGLRIVDSEGWMIVAPQKPSESRTRVVNRQALGTTLRVADARGNINLDVWADFASKQRKAPRSGEIDESYLRIINNSAAEEGLSQFSFNGGWQTLQFYASMSTAQRQALQQSGQIQLRTLSQYQIGLVMDQLFNSFDGPRVNRSNQGNPREIFAAFGGVSNERTLLLPNGMPRDGYLSFNLKNTEIAQASSGTEGTTKFMSAESLAFERVRSESPELASFGPQTSFSQYRIAGQRAITFQFHLTPEMTFTRQLQDNTPGNQAFASFERLPADFRQKVERSYEQLKRSWGAGSGRGNQVPPP